MNGTTGDDPAGAGREAGLLQGSVRHTMAPAVAAVAKEQGDAAFARGDFAGAARLYQSCLHLYRTAGDRVAMAGVLATLGDVVRTAGYAEKAPPLYQESLRIYQDLGDRAQVAALQAKLRPPLFATLPEETTAAGAMVTTRGGRPSGWLDRVRGFLARR